MKRWRMGLILTVILGVMAGTGCGSILRDVLGQPDPQTSVTVRCDEGGGEDADESDQAPE